MAIIKATPEVLSSKGLIKALLVKYGTIVLKDASRGPGDPSGIYLTLEVHHPDHPADHELDLLIWDDDGQLRIEET